MSTDWFIVSWAPVEGLAFTDEALRDMDGNIWEDVYQYQELSLAIADPQPIGDCVALLGGYFVLSKRARSILERTNLDDSIGWVRVVVQHVSAAGPFWLLNATKQWDVLDRERSTSVFYPGTTVIGHVERWVLDSTKVPECDVFQGNKGKWFVCAGVRARILTAGLTGFRFEEVMIH